MEKKKGKFDHLKSWKPAGYRQAYHSKHGMANVSSAEYEYLKKRDRALNK